ncbi:MAG: hypothetical protein FWG29_05125 [Treponema sp.]|nr:hypothetical protein [Treponema sp.]
MKHLCIVNPKAGQVTGQINELVDEIKDFFVRNPRMDHTIHVTRWKRDASGYTMRFVNNASEMVRVYAFGGSGTLFEVINGVLGLPNVQVAYFPMGTDDDLLNVFGKNARNEFTSMRNLSLSPVITIDTILAGNHYVVTHVLIGLETISYQLGLKISEQFGLPLKISYFLAGIYYTIINSQIRHYHIELEGAELEGNYAGIFIANASGNGLGSLAPDAVLNDGLMDLYTIKPVPKDKIIQIFSDYQKGQYAKWPEYITHYRCKKLRITSSVDMAITLDGEFFYDTELILEVHPASLNFVCPANISASVLMQSEKRPPKKTGSTGSPGQIQEVDIADLLSDGDSF